MYKHFSPIRVVVFACALACVFVGVVTPGASVGAQQPRATDLPSAAEMRRRADSADVAAERAESTFVRVRDARAARTRATRSVDGIVVEYDSATVQGTDMDLIARGIERGTATLRMRFAADARTFLDSMAWSARGARARPRFLMPVELTAGRGAGAIRTTLRRPIDDSEVSRLVLRATGSGLVRIAPNLARAGAAEVSFAVEPMRYEYAARELRLGWSSVARRCASGSVASCRAVLATPTNDAERLALWFVPADYRALLGAAGEGAIIAPDSIFYAERRRCNAGDEAACARLVPRIRIPDPVSTGLRATFLMHALDGAPPGTLDRLRRVPPAHPATMLAAATGVSEDSLIVGWMRKSDIALAEARPSSVPLVATSAIWCALLLFGATRRRPE